MENTAFLQSLSAAALDSQMPKALAVILNVGPQNAVLQELSKLFVHQDFTVYYIEDPMGTQVAQVLERCKALHLPCFILNPGEEPASEVVQALLTQEPDKSTCSLISRGDPQFPGLIAQSPALSYFAWIGFQRYHCGRTLLQELGKEHYEMLRLGLFREKTHLAEPLLREAACHLIDMRAVRFADSPDGLNPSPNGLYAEELCTLCRYIGLCDTLTVCNFYGYKENPGEHNITGQLIAQALWHLLDALSINTFESPTLEKCKGSLQKKCVQLGEKGQDIIFFHSVETGRWWVEITNIKDESKPWFIACSSDDYTTATHGEIPLKWLKYYQYYNKL